MSDANSAQTNMYMNFSITILYWMSHSFSTVLVADSSSLHDVREAYYSMLL
jgi:hypothetical protein